MGRTADVGSVRGRVLVVGEAVAERHASAEGSPCPSQPMIVRSSSSGHLEPYQAFPVPLSPPNPKDEEG